MTKPSPLAIDGVTLETAWWGRDLPGPKLVLLHEGLGCVALWRDLPERLHHATGRPVFAYSRQGYGQSDPVPLPRPLTYMHDEAARLPALLDAAGIGPALLVGHSDGASIAAIAAGSNYDARIRGLILIAPHFFTEPMGLAAIADARDTYETLRPRLAQYHRDPDNAFRGWNDAWLDPGFRAWRIDEYLPYIRLPILLIQGQADPYGTQAQLQIVQDLAYGPVETLLLPAVKHAPHLEAQPATLDAIAAFTQRLALHEHAL